MEHAEETPQLVGPPRWLAPRKAQEVPIIELIAVPGLQDEPLSPGPSPLSDHTMLAVIDSEIQTYTGIAHRIPLTPTPGVSSLPTSPRRPTPPSRPRPSSAVAPGSRSYCARDAHHDGAGDGAPGMPSATHQRGLVTAPRHQSHKAPAIPPAAPKFAYCKTHKKRRSVAYMDLVGTHYRCRPECLCQVAQGTPADRTLPMGSERSLRRPWL